MSKTVVDVMMVGGGPAGTAAAIAARRHDLHAMLLDRHNAGDGSPGIGWLGPKAIDLCGVCGIDATAAGAMEFTGLRMWPWDCATSVVVGGDDLRGWTLPPARLRQALQTTARNSGVEMVQPVSVTDLSLGEDAATVTLDDGQSISAAALILADGAAGTAAARAQLSTAPQHTAAGATALAQTGEAHAGLDVILGANPSPRLATVVRGGGHAQVTLMTQDHATPAIDQLRDLIVIARQAGALPSDFEGRPAPVPNRAGVALELETHAGKRCLLVGDAGGFVTAFSNEGIYPAMRSGWLAAETIAAALRKSVLQDALAEFNTIWRADLADYLRMPNTDLGLLLPLVFKNEQMSARVARAFLLGDAF